MQKLCRSRLSMHQVQATSAIEARSGERQDSEEEGSDILGWGRLKMGGEGWDGAGPPVWWHDSGVL